ncbi:MAG: helix-turn-helix transcriptional regulator [Clostridia bacterium]|nr:helix-turn-helix transcriptional regulator [Clostridia bacterium]
MNNITMNTLPKDFKPLPIYLNTVCANYKQDYLTSPNGRDFHQILFVTEGEGILHYNGRVYNLKKGCAFFTSAYIPVSYYSTNQLVVAFLTVKGDAVDKLTKHFGVDGFLFRKLVDTEKYLADINAIISEYYTYKRESIISALAYSFYVNFFEPQAQEFNQIKEISLYIEKNFTKKLTLKKMAALYGISVSKLCHNFKSEFGYTVFEYILNLRLNYARNLILLNPKSKIKDIALSCGFDDMSYFCRAYKAKFGKNPSEDKI